ncbi:MAG: hypothetical protein RL033_1321 [Pseudomonadota bacterium]|jgi:hypothetical protein
MKHRTALLASLCVAAACTYKEYNTYNQIGGPDDAGIDRQLASGQGGSSAPNGGGGAGGTDAGAGGLGSSGGSAGSSPDALGCTGCLRLSVLTGRSAELQRDYSPRLDLSESLVRFRVRVRDYGGPVNVEMYVESDDHVAGSHINEAAYSSASLQASAGWQDVGIDMALQDSFLAPGFVDGGAAGGGFNPGVPFDKSRVERVGLRVSPADSSGVLTPAIVEIDGLTFSTPDGLNLDFSADGAGFELVDEDAATVTHIP